MKRTKLFLFIVLYLLTLNITAQTKKLSVFRPGEIWKDNNGMHINAHGGGVLYYNNTYYWFGEHKVEGTLGNTAQVGVHVYSSKDLYNWKDEGIALKVSNDPASDIAKGCILERPKVIYNNKTKKFVMWFHLELLGHKYLAARSGVAVADNVTGPYTFTESFRPNAGVWPLNIPEEWKKPFTDEEKKIYAGLKFPGGPEPGCPEGLVLRGNFPGGQMARDMSVFVDDDGKAYHIYASEDNGTLQVSLLTDDYLKPAGKYARLFPLSENESPCMFRYNGKYYLITSKCNGWNPSTARLGVAESIWGPWTALGNPCVGPEEQTKITFESQSTHILPVAGKKNAFIFMADRWRPDNAIDGRYVWLPIEFDAGKPIIKWHKEWDLKFFNKAK